MNRRDQVRVRQDQQIDVVFDEMSVIAEARASHGGFVQPVLLDHRPHRTVEHENAFGEEVAEPGGGGGHPPTLTTPNVQLPTANDRVVSQLGRWQVGGGS